jgi:hypothetical protein
MNCVFPGGNYGAEIKLTSLLGDPGYNDDGYGENVTSGCINEITWDSPVYTGSYCKLYYSVDGGNSWNVITNNTDNDGIYYWLVPSGLSSLWGRIKIEFYNSSGTLIGADGSWGNFIFVEGSSIDTLYTDIHDTTLQYQSFYLLNHSYNTWGAVGLRSEDTIITDWNITLYTSDDFDEEGASSTMTSGVDFVVFDQNHLSPANRGVKSFRAWWTADAMTEFEGSYETLTVGTITPHYWEPGDVVEIWDIDLIPGTYRFDMTYNYGSADLDMALFSSLGGNYYKNREQYMARSVNSGGGVDESFMVTIPLPDTYGFVVWANDNNGAWVTITPVQVTGGIWTGNISSDWDTPGNWNDSIVPDSSISVYIPANTPYSPYINVDEAYAKSITIELNSILTIGGYNLMVDENMNIYGTLVENSANGGLYCNGNIFWEAGSMANITDPGAQIHIGGDWNFELGANVHLNMGTVEFTGTSPAYIRSYSPTCYFFNINVNKTGTFLGISQLTNADLMVNGTLAINSGSTFNGYSSTNTILKGGINNTGGHFKFFNGTAQFTGTPNYNLKPNTGDYFNNLTVNVTSSLGFDNLYTDSLVINGTLTIESGNLNSGSHTIVIGGDWINMTWQGGFSEGTGKVNFSKSNGYQFCYGDDFYNVTKSSDSSSLIFTGMTNILNNCELHGSTYAYEETNINNLLLADSGAKFTASVDALVSVEHLEMGSLTYGSVVAKGADMIVADLSNDGLFGSFKVEAGGLLDITQDTSHLVDLNGNINISDGVMNINGGSSTSCWPGSADASITMSGGILDVKDVSIRINNQGNGSTLTTGITGGIIRTSKDLYIYNAFSPQGGALEFYGSSPSLLDMYYIPSNLHDLLINKTGTGTVTSNSTFIKIDGDLTIQSGTLISPEYVFIGGNWTNNAGQSGFSEGTNTVKFIGTQQSNINNLETFYNLTIDKSSGSSVTPNDDFIVTGNFQMLNGNMSATTVNNYYFKGNFINETNGSWNDHQSTLHFTGGSNTSISMGSGNGYFHSVEIDKDYNYLDLLVTSNFNILDSGSLTINNGKISTNSSIIQVSGSIEINSNGALYLNANSELITYNGTLSVNSGGIFESVGAYGNEVQVRSNFDTSADVDIQVNSGGAIGAVYTDFTDMVNEGVYIKPGAIVETSYPFSHCSFSQGKTGGRFLTIDNNQNFTVQYANFPDNSNVNYNVYKSVAAGDVYFENACGIFAGEAFDYDPYNHVYWTENITISGVVTGVSCYNGSNGAVDITVTGGTAAYSYLWSDGSTLCDRTGLTAGNYTVTVTDYYGAKDFASFTITQPLPITLFSSITNVICYGGSNGAIDLTVTGGVSPYWYLWNNGATTQDRTNLTSGTYSVTVKDVGNCIKTASYNLSQPPPLILNVSITNASCFGVSNGAIDLTVTGGTSPYAYLWNSGATTQDRTGITAGTYSVTVSDAVTCKNTASYIVSQPPELNITNVITNVSTAGGSDGSINITVSGGVTVYSYNWSDGTTTEDLAGIQAGIYYLTVTDGNGCNAVDTMQVTEPAGLDAQIVDLVYGWSYISTYIIPVDSSVAVVFAPVVSNIIIMKNGGGNVYWPAYNLNQIVNMVTGEGYQVKMSIFQQITITGTAVIPELKPINCPVGWSILGYLRQSPGNIETMLSALNPNIIIVKNGNGQVYWPSTGVNNIVNMIPGQGYQIKLSTADILIYPANSVVNLKSEVKISKPLFFGQVLPTGDNMIIGIPQEAWNVKPESGDEIGVFNNEDVLIGSAVLTGSFTAVTAWGKEIFEVNENGSNHDHLSLKIWHYSNQAVEEIIVNKWIQGSDEYISNGINIIGKLTMAGVPVNKFCLGQNVPNPFISKTHIPFCLAESCHVTVTLYNSLGQITGELISGNLEAGKHEITFAASDYPPGVYYYKLITDKFTATRSLIIK